MFLARSPLLSIITIFFASFKCLYCDPVSLNRKETLETMTATASTVFFLVTVCLLMTYKYWKVQYIPLSDDIGEGKPKKLIGSE